ncbi:uncharacterized protein LMH87_007572 [Akanthomyces muscarius]|uniref:Uncharacterized protein n=1 Tax=Akanthomyces muscarius TaxID=2231603 RepID=A0A9W8QMT8_AKAMU|nr:uncharacterized protein LMH87_007572 [Akanthomyces muscarius]KAJ4161538.1 hypothetical protein LMH87_007572 [Akanthomyces muscarius]
MTASTSRAEISTATSDISNVPSIDEYTLLADEALNETFDDSSFPYPDEYFMLADEANGAFDDSNFPLADEYFMLDPPQIQA